MNEWSVISLDPQIHLRHLCSKGVDGFVTISTGPGGTVMQIQCSCGSRSPESLNTAISLLRVKNRTIMVETAEHLHVFEKTHNLRCAI